MGPRGGQLMNGSGEPNVDVNIQDQTLRYVNLSFLPHLL